MITLLSHLTVLCPIPGDTLTNGIISYSESRRPIVAGTMATYTCNTGYTLDSANTRTCEENTGWDRTMLPTCQSKSQHLILSCLVLNTAFVYIQLLTVDH